MKNLMWLGSISIFIVLAVGCGMLDSGYDIKRQPDGTGLFLDTPRMWQEWMESVDREIPREVSYRNGTSWEDPLKGKPQGGGTWDEYWLGRIRALQSGHQEHPQRYIDYIVESRRKAGLPTLVGYP